MKLDLYYIDKINARIKFYKENPELQSKSDPYKGLDTVEEVVAKLEKDMIKDDKKLVQVLCKFRKYKKYLSPFCIELINKILGDKRLREKIRIVPNTIFYENYIWLCIMPTPKDSLNQPIEINPLDYELELKIDVDYTTALMYDGEMYHVSAKKQINWYNNHFDLIFFHIDLDFFLKEINTEEDFVKFLEALYDKMIYVDFPDYKA